MNENKIRIKKILIANRGEIACRIIKTAKRLNINTVAVYSEIDKDALFVRLADESYCIGPAPSQFSYLNQEKIIETAQQARVDAIHPGYGFLSENASFAQLCEEKHIIFIGPSSKVIALMGDKHQAKKIMSQANVPVVKGYFGQDQSLETLITQAAQIGFPVMIKASKGGGGKGMRLVYAESELKSALISAQREACSSFGDDELILEQYIEQARHIEVQIISDHHHNHFHLYDRECSIQRRHQKIIEEAPAPNISTKTREKMAQTAVKAAKAIDYQGVGTIEFLLDHHENFYFMEMNTRLQVEHPVTEMICQKDLVAWQIYIAENNILPMKQEEINIQGHAIEARIYAEDPQNNFMPDSGKITHLQFPTHSSAKQNSENGAVVPTSLIRIETGVEDGSEISVYYDPLLAKLVVWDQDRIRAVKLLQRVLNLTQILGVKTNLNLLYQISAEEDFIKGKINTEFVANHPTLFARNDTIPLPVLMAASFSIWHAEKKLKNFSNISDAQDLTSPWLAADGWQALQHLDNIFLSFWSKNQHYNINIQPKTAHGYDWYFEKHHETIRIEWQENKLNVYNLNLYLESSQQKYYFSPIFNINEGIDIFFNGEHFHFTQNYPIQMSASTSSKKASLTAPMPGIITHLYVQIGQEIKAGDPLLTLEAMKMEHTIHAPHSGTVTEIFLKLGERVSQHQSLVAISPIDQSNP